MASMFFELQMILHSLPKDIFKLHSSIFISYKQEDDPYFSISAKLIASSIPGIAFDRSEIKLSIPSVPIVSSCSTVGSTSYKTPP